MSTDSVSKNDRALAILATRLTEGKRSALGPAPSSEDLAAFYDGKLSAVRRTQVLSHIANSPDRYRQWLALVDAAQTEAHAASARTVNSSLNKSWRTAAQWIKHARMKTVMLGGGAVAAVLALVITFTTEIPLYEDVYPYEEQVAGLYSDYAGDWVGGRPELNNDTLPSVKLRGNTSAPQSETERPSISARGDSIKTPIQKSLARGLAQGLRSLGSEFRIVGFSLDAAEGAPRGEHEYLQALGKIAAIAYFKCRGKTTSEFYRDADEIIRALAPQLAQGEDPDTSSLSVLLKGAGSQQERVCGAAWYIVSIVSS